jgi:hypothetical protein
MGGEATVVGEKLEEREEEKEVEDEEEEAAEENNWDKIKQPSPGRWGITLIVYYSPVRL